MASFIYGISKSMALFNSLDLNWHKTRIHFYYLILPTIPTVLLPTVPPTLWIFPRQKKRPKEVNPRVSDILFKVYVKDALGYTRMRYAVLEAGLRPLEGFCSSLGTSVLPCFSEGL